jgi:muramidase (phage lysozyme)
MLFNPALLKRLLSAGIDPLDMSKEHTDILGLNDAKTALDIRSKTDVVMLQQSLNMVSAHKLTVDGIYGRKTNEAVLLYEKYIPYKVNRSNTGPSIQSTPRSAGGSKGGINGFLHDLREIIILGEGTAGSAGYDTMYANGKYLKSRLPLTGMTIGQVVKYQSDYLDAQRKANSSRARKRTVSSAAGKYQLIQGTLIETYKSIHLSKDDMFNEENQNKLANQRLKVRIGRDLDSIFLRGTYNTSTIIKIVDALAKGWASIPHSGSGYKTSYYNMAGKPFAQAGGSPQPVQHDGKHYVALIEESLKTNLLKKG